MKANLLQMGSALLALTLLINACNKNDEPKPEDPETTTTRSVMETEAGGEVIFDDVFNNVAGVNNTEGIGATGEFAEKSPEQQPGTLASTCLTLTIVKTTANEFPRRVTIDFGTAGCTG